jgi:hypothetical protein
LRSLPRRRVAEAASIINKAEKEGYQESTASEEPAIIIIIITTTTKWLCDCFNSCPQMCWHTALCPCEKEWTTLSEQAL